MKKILVKFKNWWFKNSSREYLYSVNEQFSNFIDNDSYVLDAGAGTAPYKGLFNHANYETADFEQVDKNYTSSTYVCDLKSIPVEAERFDFIIFNQVMEHLPEPLLVLEELHRVMKPGGRIICTCPLYYQEHEIPYDFYRYTQFAHRHLFGRAGFTIESIDWLEGYFGTVAYQLECMFKYLPVNPKGFPMGLIGWIAAPIIIGCKVAAFLFAGVFYRLDLRFKVKSGMPKNYVVIAKKV